MITPKPADQALITGLFHANLLTAPPYRLLKDSDTQVKLDQNECPFDWPARVKDRVFAQLKTQAWNRYPEPFAPLLNELLAQRNDICPEAILTGPGSNYLIPLLLDAIAPQLRGKLIIAQPSFALFEEYAQLAGYDYQLWPLDEHLDYQLDLMPDVPPFSLILFASPNNPTGSAVSVADLKTLLTSHPTSLILADEAYYEFSKQSYQDLLKDHGNLIILRTLSKTMASAGVRFGYMMAAPNLLEQLAKKRLPYLLNHFTIAASQTLISDPEMMTFMNSHIAHIKGERKRVYEAMTALNLGQHLEVKESQTNFLLLRSRTQEQCQKLFQYLISKKIMVRNISKGSRLEGCLRASLGLVSENDRLIEAIAAYHREI